MSIEEIIATVTTQEVESAQATVETHFEGNVKDAQMIMIAFD